MGGFEMYYIVKIIYLINNSLIKRKSTSVMDSTTITMMYTLSTGSTFL